MNKYKKILVTLLSVLLIVVAALGIAACNLLNPEDPEEPKTNEDTFTVTVTATGGGEVSLSPEGTKSGNVYTYNKDTAVTVTVTPDVLKVVDSFKVDGAEKTLTADNKYSLTVTANTTIAATFKYQDKSTDALILDEEYYGTYVCMKDDEPDSTIPSIVVCEIGVFWLGRGEIKLVETSYDEMHWTVDIEGFDEEGTWSFGYDGNGYMSLQFNSDDYTTYYDYSFKTDNVTYRIKLVYDDTLGTVTLDPDKDAYEPNEEVTVTVTANSGYVVSSVYLGGDEFGNGDEVTLDENGTYKFNISEDTKITVTYALGSIPTEWGFIGTWKNLADGTDTFVVTANGATWQGKNYSLVGAQEEMGAYFIQFDIDGAGEIQYAADTNAFVLEVEDTDGLTTYVFVRGDGDSIFEDEPNCTAGTYTGMEVEETLVIDSDRNIKIDDSDVAIYYDGGRYWLYHTKLYTLWFDSGYVTLRTADESDVIHYTANEVGAIPADLAGEWTGADDVTLSIADGGTITWNNDEGYSLRLIGVTSEGSVGYTMVLTKDEKSVIITGSIGFVSNEETPEVLNTLQMRIDISAFVDFETADPTELVTEYVFTKTLTKLSTPTGLTNGTYTAEGGSFSSIVVSADGIKAMVSDWDYETDSSIEIAKDVYVAASDNGSYIVYIDSMFGFRYTLSVSEGNIVLDNGYGPQTYSLGTGTESAPTEPAV